MTTYGLCDAQHGTFTSSKPCVVLDHFLVGDSVVDATHSSQFICSITFAVTSRNATRRITASHHFAQTHLPMNGCLILASSLTVPFPKLHPSVCCFYVSDTMFGPSSLRQLCSVCRRPNVPKPSIQSPSMALHRID